MKRTMGLILLLCMLLTCFMQCTVSAEVGKVEKIGSLPGAYTRKVMAQIENFNYILPEDTEKGLVPLIGTYLHPEKEFPAFFETCVPEGNRAFVVDLLLCEKETREVYDGSVELFPAEVKFFAEMVIGGGDFGWGKDYHLYYLTEDGAEEQEILSSDKRSFSFEMQKYGTYAFTYDPKGFFVNFYDGNKGEDGEPVKYYEKDGLTLEDTVSVLGDELKKPVRDGYVFTYWSHFDEGFGSVLTQDAKLCGNWYANWIPEEAYTPYEIRLSSPAQIIRGQENGKTLDLVMNENVFIDPDEYEAGIEEWEITGSEEISIEKVEKVDDRHLKLTLKGNSSSANGTLKIGVRFPRDYVTYEKALYPSDAPGAQGEQDERHQLDEAGVILSKYVSDNTVTIKGVTKPNIHISGGGSASISVPKDVSAIAVPKAAPAAGEVLKGSKVELTTTSSGAEIRYTTDGTTPDKNSALYSDGIVIEKDMTVKAIAIAGSRKSGVLTAHYTVREPKMQLKENIQSIRYIKGYSDNCFKADQAITRYEVLEALDHLLEIEEIKEAHTFKDVESRYADLVSRFAGVGIIDGYTDQTFGGNRGITRAELIKILCIPWKIESVEKETERFSDIGAHWAKGVIAAFTDRGYLKGYEDGTFRPDSEITRAEFVTLMNRVIGIKTQVRTHQFDDLTESYWAYEDIQKAYIFE